MQSYFEFLTFGKNKTFFRLALPEIFLPIFSPPPSNSLKNTNYKTIKSTSSNDFTVAVCEQGRK